MQGSVNWQFKETLYLGLRGVHCAYCQHINAFHYNVNRQSQVATPKMSALALMTFVERVQKPVTGCLPSGPGWSIT